MILPVPSYRLDGWLAIEHETPSAASVMYHIQLREYFTRTDFNTFPQHIRDYVRHYCTTMYALLDAGI